VKGIEIEIRCAVDEATETAIAVLGDSPQLLSGHSKQE
jgi:hypothetical protein